MVGVDESDNVILIVPPTFSAPFVLYTLCPGITTSVCSVIGITLLFASFTTLTVLSDGAKIYP